MVFTRNHLGPSAHTGCVIKPLQISITDGTDSDFICSLQGNAAEQLIQ